jgi:TRAP-type C4-dicarboxylate transport system permease small subunit
MKLLKWLNNHFEEILLGSGLIAMTVILTAQIILRFIFKSSLTWAEELSCIILVWSGFLSISYTIHKNSAMRLTMLASSVPLPYRNIIMLIAQIFMLALFAFFAVQSIDLLGKTQQRTSALNMPMVYVYIMVFIGFALAVFRCVQSMIRIIKNFKTGDELNWLPEETTKEEGTEC